MNTYRIPNGAQVTTRDNLSRLQNGQTLRTAHGWARYFVGCYRVGKHNKPFNQSLVYSTAENGAANIALSALSAWHN